MHIKDGISDVCSSDLSTQRLLFQSVPVNVRSCRKRSFALVKAYDGEGALKQLLFGRENGDLVAAVGGGSFGNLGKRTKRPYGFRLKGGRVDILQIGISVYLHRVRQNSRVHSRTHVRVRSEEHTSELQSLMRISYA